jgi:hypothetical protein
MTYWESGDLLSANYDAVASTYQEGRAMSDAALDIWGTQRAFWDTSASAERQFSGSTSICA